MRYHKIVMLAVAALCALGANAMAAERDCGGKNSNFGQCDGHVWAGWALFQSPGDSGDGGAAASSDAGAGPGSGGSGPGGGGPGGGGPGGGGPGGGGPGGGGPGGGGPGGGNGCK